jgi:hypothetical protein
MGKNEEVAKLVVGNMITKMQENPEKMEASYVALGDLHPRDSAVLAMGVLHCAVIDAGMTNEEVLMLVEALLVFGPKAEEHKLLVMAANPVGRA